MVGVRMWICANRETGIGIGIILVAVVVVVAVEDIMNWMRDMVRIMVVVVMGMGGRVMNDGDDFVDFFLPNPLAFLFFLDST